MSSDGTFLKALLRERHLQEHRAFCREYDRIARRIDPGLQHGHPSKATFYRWLSGDLQKLPYPGNCRVLEAMLPGWSAKELFRLRDSDEEIPKPTPGQEVKEIESDISSDDGQFVDLAAVFVSRSDFAHSFPLDEFLNGVRDIRALGISLNLLCQDYGDRRVRSLLDDGATIRCLFLDPHGDSIKAREHEEGYEPGLLSSLTTFNLQVLERLRLQLSDETQGRLQLHVYDEPARFNITIVDRRQCIVQPYLPAIRGVDSPTFVIDRRNEDLGLFSVFEQVFDTIWKRSRPVG